MGEITKIETVQDYCSLFGIEALHPLISVVDCGKMKPIPHGKRLYSLYAVLLKDTDCGAMGYGLSMYDYRAGTVLFAAPGQVMGADDDGRLHQPAGWALVFHPAMLRGTPLVQRMNEYSFFSYGANEALHLSEQERRTVTECMEKIQAELQHPADKYTRLLVADNVKLLLDYCLRFYDRQFTTRESINSDILVRFEMLLDDYLRSGKPLVDGLPTVQYCADELCLSANYLSDLLRKATGLSASSISTVNFWNWQRSAYSTHPSLLVKYLTNLDFRTLNISAGGSGRTQGVVRMSIGQGCEKPAVVAWYVCVFFLFACLFAYNGEICKCNMSVKCLSGFVR